MSEATYYAEDERGIKIPVERERAERLSRSGLTVTAITGGGDLG